MKKSANFNELIKKIPNRYLLSFYLGDMFRKAVNENVNSGEEKFQSKMMKEVFDRFILIDIPEDVKKKGE